MTDWENCYQTGQTNWDRGEPAPVLRQLVSRQPGLFQGRVLIPGCGLGHDARLLSAHGAKVTGVDIAPTALKKARELDTSGAIDFCEADLLALPADMLGAFDAVWEHTCLCALPPEMRKHYIQSVVSTLKPGGIVTGIFYINPDLDPGETGPPFPITVEELIALWNVAGFEPVEQWVPDVAYADREGRELAMILHRRA